MAKPLCAKRPATPEQTELSRTEDIIMTQFRSIADELNLENTPGWREREFKMERTVTMALQLFHYKQRVLEDAVRYDEITARCTEHAARSLDTAEVIRDLKEQITAVKAKYRAAKRASQSPRSRERKSNDAS
jgi:beta-phosphoglucomutase-like phosphatase (HAD superfamily)